MTVTPLALVALFVLVAPFVPSSTAAARTVEIVSDICFFTVELYHTFVLFVNCFVLVRLGFVWADFCHAGCVFGGEFKKVT